MPAPGKAQKVECLNPDSGGKMNIDKATYNLFYSAIHYTLKKAGAVTFTQLTEGVTAYFKQQKISFQGSIGWYAVTIKNNMQSGGAIEVFTEKGKKLHRLSR